jgi:hypothetical protein
MPVLRDLIFLEYDTTDTVKFLKFWKKFLLLSSGPTQSRDYLGPQDKSSKLLRYNIVYYFEFLCPPPPDVEAQGDLTKHVQWARPVLCKRMEKLRNAISVINLQVAHFPINLLPSRFQK